jgi:hypothetical protein
MCLTVTLVLMSGSPAQAGIYKNIANGLALFDIQLVGQENVLGNGFDIFAFADYNNRTFDFGLMDLTLTGDVVGSVGYTMRGLPTASFSLNTGGAPMNYTFDFNSGVQDLLARGQVFVDIDTEINALGFYDQTFLISNRGSYDTDGFVVRDSGTLDFDAGPIVISGNIFIDILAAVTEPFYASCGTENPFSKITGRATKAVELQASADLLRSRLEAGHVLTDEEIATLINNTVIAAMLGGQPSDHLFDDLFLPEGILDAEKAALMGIDGIDFLTAPEPTSFVLLGAALAPLIPLRLRQRR